MKHLVEENTSLVDYMNQTEKDTIDVVSYLKKLDAEKDNEVIFGGLVTEFRYI